MLKLPSETAPYSFPVTHSGLFQKPRARDQCVQTPFLRGSSGISFLSLSVPTWSPAGPRKLSPSRWLSVPALCSGLFLPTHSPLSQWQNFPSCPWHPTGYLLVAFSFSCEGPVTSPHCGSFPHISDRRQHLGPPRPPLQMCIQHAEASVPGKVLCIEVLENLRGLFSANAIREGVSIKASKGSFFGRFSVCLFVCSSLLRFTGACLELASLRNVASFLGKRIAEKMGFEYLTFVVLVFIFITSLMNKVTISSIKGQNEVVAKQVLFYISKMLKYWECLKTLISWWACVVGRVQRKQGSSRWCGRSQGSSVVGRIAQVS